jgi:hypothetical protein
MLGVFVLRGSDNGGSKPSLEVRLEIQREFCLRSIAFENLFNRRNAVERLIENLRTNTSLERLGAKRVEPLIERRWEWWNWRNRRRLLSDWVPRYCSEQNRENDEP